MPGTRKDRIWKGFINISIIINWFCRAFESWINNKEKNPCELKWSKLSDEEMESMTGGNMSDD